MQIWIKKIQLEEKSKLNINSKNLRIQKQLKKKKTFLLLWNKWSSFNKGNATKWFFKNAKFLTKITRIDQLKSFTILIIFPFYKIN